MATTTGGYLFVTATHYATVDVSAVTDTVGNTFVRAGSVQGVSGDPNDNNTTWYTPSPIVGTASNVVTVAYTGTADYRRIVQSFFSWGSVTSITYGAEAIHIFQTASAKASTTLSVADEGLVLGSFNIVDGVPIALSSNTGTMLMAAPNSASCELGVAYRLFTGSSIAATITVVGPTTGVYGITAKSFRGVGGSSAAAASPLRTITLINAGT
jgi:hypothetical protein